MCYDGLVLIAIWMIGTSVVVIVGDTEIGSGNPLFQAYLLALAYVYFHVSWRRAGQTLGMRAWRIRIDAGAGPMTAAQSLLRVLAGLASIATLGLGFAWALARDDRCAWPDLASGSRLIVVPAGGSAAQEH